MTDLSPAAQAVLNEFAHAACGSTYKVREGLAAALRAVADQVVPEEELIMNARGTKHWHKAIQRAEIRAAFFAIAAELEAQQ
jgi:hypothetical protein